MSIAWISKLQKRCLISKTDLEQFFHSMQLSHQTHLNFIFALRTMISYSESDPSLYMSDNFLNLGPQLFK